jgi:hypothetical protein
MRDKEGAPGEQVNSFPAAYAEKVCRLDEAVAAREAVFPKPGVSRRMTTCTVVPKSDVELPSGYVGQNSLQLSKCLHVHGDLRWPPPSRVYGGQLTPPASMGKPRRPPVTEPELWHSLSQWAQAYCLSSASDNAQH